MAKLLKKEFVLSMHPVTPFMLVLAAMVLIPNYPYCVIFFYVSMEYFSPAFRGARTGTLSILLACLSARGTLLRRASCLPSSLSLYSF